MDSGPFIWTVITFTFDLYSLHDPTIFCNLLPSEAQQLYLIVGSKTICTFKCNKPKEAFCVLDHCIHHFERNITMCFFNFRHFYVPGDDF